MMDICGTIDGDGDGGAASVADGTQTVTAEATMIDMDEDMIETGVMRIQANESGTGDGQDETIETIAEKEDRADVIEMIVATKVEIETAIEIETETVIETQIEDHH